MIHNHYKEERGALDMMLLSLDTLHEYLRFTSNSPRINCTIVLYVYDYEYEPDSTQDSTSRLQPNSIRLATKLTTKAARPSQTDSDSHSSDRFHSFTCTRRVGFGSCQQQLEGARTQKYSSTPLDRQLRPIPTSMIGSKR